MWLGGRRALVTGGSARWGGTVDMAALALAVSLCLDDARLISGQNIHVDGGW